MKLKPVFLWFRDNAFRLWEGIRQNQSLLYHFWSFRFSTPLIRRGLTRGTRWYTWFSDLSKGEPESGLFMAQMHHFQVVSSFKQNQSLLYHFWRSRFSTALIRRVLTRQTRWYPWCSDLSKDEPEYELHQSTSSLFRL